MAGFTLRQAEYFCAVARVGTLAGAAADVQVSRSALAGGLDELERALGVKLLRRRRASGVELTPDGLTFLEGALDLLRVADELSVRASRGSLIGQLHVGCFGSLAPTVLPPVIDAFSRDHPDVELVVEAESQDTLMRRLASGEIELAVLHKSGPWPHLATSELYRARMHVILAANHPLAARAVVAVDDLAHEPLVLLETPPSSPHAMAYLHAAQITPRIVHRTSNFELVRSLVARGLGYSLFVQHPHSDSSYEGRPLVARPLHPAPPEQSIVVAWHRERPLSARARQFIAVAREVVRPNAEPSVYGDTDLLGLDETGRQSV